jgi:outer membrane protein assembly factor BamE (lipoprotein component of BamABCDE complex)
LRTLPPIRFARLLILGLIPALLSGCPIPIPAGYASSSRENIGPELPEMFIAGETTRADVLLLIGEPDLLADDESWMAYKSTYGKGGVVFVIAGGGGAGGVGGEKVQHRYLIVEFDANGRVESANFMDESCWEGLVVGSSGTDTRAPCSILETHLPSATSSIEHHEPPSEVTPEP